MSPLPAQVLAAGVLVWDGHGRLLVVRTHNRSTWILPGGIVEAGESPSDAGRREVLEEVGLEVRVGRLLAVQHLAGQDAQDTGQDARPSSVQFVFDSAPLDATAETHLQSEEIAAVRWLEPNQAAALMSEASRARLQAALAARTGCPVAYLDSHRRA